MFSLETLLPILGPEERCKLPERVGAELYRQTFGALTVLLNIPFLPQNHNC